MAVSPSSTNSKKCSYAYVNLILQNGAGIRAKLQEQAEAIKRGGLDMDVVWLTRGLTDATEASDLIVRDMGIGSRIQCRIRQMRELRRMQLRYKGILLRYPLCEPMTLLGLPRPSNIVTEHHTKELPELRVCKDPRFMTELVFGSLFLRRFAGFFAVTEEILAYEVERSRQAKPAFVTYNAISTNRFPAKAREGTLLKDWPKIRFVTASSSFWPWQGLDSILDAFSKAPANYELHVCGEVMSSDMERARSVSNVIMHGALKVKELLAVYSQCDVGIASFGLHRKGLSEGTTLKVREYLACGLPVVLSHRDPAFPLGFPYVRQMERLDLDMVTQWCDKMRPVTREAIFRLAEPHISIDTLVRKQVGHLNDIFE